MDTVVVWLVRTDLPDPAPAPLAAVLDPDERRRADSLRHPDDRRRFVVTHGAARVILGRRLGIPAVAVGWRHGQHGKPELVEGLTGACVSMSHSGGLSLVAVTRHRPVGVDVQRLLPDPVANGLAGRYFPEEEAELVAAGARAGGPGARFTRLWTRKEACVKAAGGRLTQGLPLPVLGTGRVLVDYPHDPAPGAYLVTDVEVPPAYRAAVALSGAAGYRVMCRQWRWPPRYGAVSAWPVPVLEAVSNADTHRYSSPGS